MAAGRRCLGASGRGTVGLSQAEAAWLPVPEAHRSLAVDVQEKDGSSLLHAFRRFLHWRRGVPALVHGTLRSVALPSPLVGFVREHEGQRVLAVFNLSDRAVVLDLAGFRIGVTMAGNGFEGCLGNDGHLQPFGVLFAELATVAVSVPMADAR